MLSAYSHKLIVMTVKPLNMKYFQFDSNTNESDKIANAASVLRLKPKQLIHYELFYK